MSTAELVAAYQSAYQRYEEAESKAEALVKVIRDAGDVLRSWKQAIVANSSVGSFVLEGGLSPSASRKLVIDAQQWPTGDQLAQTLMACLKARKAAQAAWDAVPANSRNSLKDPPPPPSSK